MKKARYLVLIIQLLLVGCSKGSQEEPVPEESLSFGEFVERWELSSYLDICTFGADGWFLPSNWSKETLDEFDNLPVEIFHNLSTCGLLETLLQHPTNRMLGPWQQIVYGLSSSSTPTVPFFNKILMWNKVAVELFGREDCFSVLVSRYLTILKTKKEDETLGRTAYIEFLLASDMCMKATSEKEKILILAMAVQGYKNPWESENWADEAICNTMISIMKACKYTPFMTEFFPKLRDGAIGYVLYTPDTYYKDGDYAKAFNDVILKYAKQFLKEQNTIIPL